MPRVRLFHWRAEEARPIVAMLRASGYTVEYPGDKANGSWRSLRENPPLAAIIDLTRLPSHGRYVAAEIRASKSMRSIPIVFLDGDSEKVERIRKDLPDAVYTSRSRLLTVLKRVKPLADAVAAPRMMNRTDRTAAEKLGIKAGARVALIDPPTDYTRVVGKLPEGASLEEEPTETLPMTLWFVRDPEAYAKRLGEIRKLASASRIWVVYPKQQAGRSPSGLTQAVIRAGGLAVGLVDYKVCSVNPVWTGLLFTRKKT